ncbi:3-dehydro-L-gulonate 2-dehydrogenase [Pelobium manganitolerans]|uniref:3-dehydro-L-gulonate 2-dehydrogenase n=1 Tax=Pelobium manganitolerans TaxID=1842495 RepID=UPI003FA3A6F9
MYVSYQTLFTELKRVLIKYGFTDAKAGACAEIFANNSLDGVYSHGLNRFPVFVDYIKEGFINVDAEPSLVKSFGVIEQWNGNLGPGVLNAKFCMDRAIALAKQNGMGCVALKNTNHWMRGGAYGWQAAEANCIGINFTNTIGIMPPWGSALPTIGNNPLIIAVPHKNGHIVLDMAMAQYSYGKLQEHELKGAELAFAGGYNEKGELSKDPSAIRKSRRPLPVGMWKGSGLAIMLDLLASILSGGQTTGAITESGKEKNVSQVYICLDMDLYPNAQQTADEILAYTKQGASGVRYPGEQTLKTREANTINGIPVDESMWAALKNL